MLSVAFRVRKLAIGGGALRLVVTHLNGPE